MTAPEQWWRALYDDLLAEVLLVRDGAEVKNTTRFLAAALDISPGCRIFDQCCGIGSLALPLARLGFEVVGVDLGQGYAARGQNAAEAEGLSVDLRAGDAFEFVPETTCDAAINWWTSFGYAETDADNLQMLSRAFESLSPGGSFALDTMNVPGVLQRFVPEMVTERETPLGLVRLTRISRHDAERSVLHKDWRFVLDSGREVRRQSSVRAYTPPELARLLRAAGFVEIRLVGSVGGEALTLESPRCIAIARRPR